MAVVSIFPVLGAVTPRMGLPDDWDHQLRFGHANKLAHGWLPCQRGVAFSPPCCYDEAMTTATITRSKLYPVGRGNYRYAWKWSYNYTLDDSPTVYQYGPGLADLRDMLKRKGHQIVETWEL